MVQVNGKKGVKVTATKDVAFPTPVWYVTRTCEHGPYIALYTYHIATYFADVKQTGEEIQKLERISSIFNHMQKSKAV